MKIRIRTSEQTYRIDIHENIITLRKLKESIHQQTQIPIELLNLSWDIAGTNLLELNCDNYDDAEIKLTNGDLLYVVGRLEKTVIKKSFVAENGETIQAGTKFHINENDSNKAVPGVVTVDSNSESANQNYRTLTSNTSSRDLETFETTSISNIQTDEEADAATLEKINEILKEEEEYMSSTIVKSPDIRAPDPVKSMRLYDDPEIVSDEIPSNVSFIYILCD